MGRVERRLGSTITLDAEKEKDLIELIDNATRQHKLGELITHLLRVYNEEPEELNKPKEELSKMIINMSKLGLTPKRYEYFNQVAKELEQMKSKIDNIYDISMKVYTLAQFGKRLGLEGKAKNLLMSEFILEKQVNDLCDTLGVDNLNHVFNSNKFEVAKERAEQSLEYIVESYDNIVQELRRNIFKEIELQVKPLELEVNPVELELKGLAIENINTTNNEKQYTNNIVKEDRNSNKETIEKQDNTDGDEIIDFGNADMDALANFFGGPK